MIEFLRNWCEELVVGVFIIIIIEMLVPNGNIKKYIRVISGIYVIFLVLNPITSNIKNINFNTVFESAEAYAEEPFQSSQEEIKNLYAKAIETEIEVEFSNIENVVVKFSENLEDIEKIEITLLSEEGNTNEIKEFIMRNYSISSGGIVWLIN